MSQKNADGTGDHTMAITFSISVWYIACVIFNWTNFSIVPLLQTSVTLTLTQVAVSVICGAAVLKFGQGKSVLFPMATVKRIVPLALGLAFANGTQVLSYAYIPVSLIQTTKASQPVVTVLFCRLVLRQTFGSLTYWSLVPIIGGFALATMTEVNLNLVGMFIAVLSALAQTFVNLYAKHLYTSDVNFKIDAQELQFLVSLLSALIIFPFWLCVCYWYPVEDGAGGYDGDQTGLLLVILVNGVLYYTENIMAYRCNQLMQRLSYSVTDTVRRLSIVVSSFVLYGKSSPTPMNIFGVVMVVSGALAFSFSQKDSPKSVEEGQADGEGEESIMLQHMEASSTAASTPPHSPKKTPTPLTVPLSPSVTVSGPSPR